MMHRWLAGLPLVVGMVALAPAQQPLPPEKQAEALLIAGQKAYNEGNLPVAAQQFTQIVQKFAGTPSGNPARYGLALCQINGPEPDLTKAIESLQGPANDGGFVDRGAALTMLGVCHRSLGLKELEKGGQNPAEIAQRQQAANQRFTQAQQAFATARDFYQGKKDDEQAARCRCDVAEMELRQNRFKEARATCEPFLKEATLAKVKARPLGLYYHGLACFLDRDYVAAGRSLNQVAPFTDPAFGLHARYLVGRVLHLSGETAEASVHYDGVVADFDKARKEAAQTLGQPDKFKNNPFEKQRLEMLAKGPIPEYVAGAAFHGACLNYEAGKFPEALPKFQAFAKDFPTSPLQPDALLRSGFCLVQLRQFDEAAKLLAPNVDKTPRLADQAQFWLGKAQFGLALTADPNNPADRDAKLKAAIDTMRKAADKANQMAGQDPDAKVRRHEMLMELADALQVARQFKEAAQVYEQLWNELALPTRREELMQRLTASTGSAGEIDRSNQRCEEFRRLFPQSVLTPAVIFRQAENSFVKTMDLAKNKNANPAELKQRYEESITRYKEVVDKFPEFERVNFARYGIGICQAQQGNLEEAVKALEAIPAPDRNGDLAGAAFLLADCLIRQAPSKAEDALQENQIREKLTSAAQLLEGYAAGNPKAADAPAALLKLGYCQMRLGAGLADANERNQTLNRAREALEKLAKDYPQSPFAAQSVIERAKVKAIIGDIGGAQNDFRQVLQNGELAKSPVAPLAALNLATLYRQQNNAAEAVKVLDDARKRFEADLAKDPERAEWASLLKYHHGVAILETGKPTDARPLFEQVVQQMPGKPVAAEAALRSAQCRIAEGKKLIEQGQQARGQAGNNPQKMQAAEQQINQGRQAVNEAADQLLRRAEEWKNPLPTLETRARLYYEAAWAWRFLAEDEINKARDLLIKQAMEANPNQPVQIPRGKIPLQPHEERANTAYKRLIEEFPDAAFTVDARFEYAEQKADRGDHEEAVKVLKEALDKEPSDRPVSPDTIERVRLRLGASLFARGDFPSSASQFEAVATNDKSPYLAQALYRAGEALVAAGEYPRAVEKLTVFRDKPEFHNRDGISDRAMLRLGQALAGAMQYDPARQTFETLLQRFGPGNAYAADARYGLAWVLQLQGKYDEAVAGYQQVIAASQAEVAAKAQSQIGQCRLAQKKYAEAAAAFLVVPYTYDYLELGFAAMLEAARAFAEDGKADQAEKLLRKVLKDAPKDSEWAKAAKERLEPKK